MKKIKSMKSGGKRGGGHIKSLKRSTAAATAFPQSPMAFPPMGMPSDPSMGSTKPAAPDQGMPSAPGGMPSPGGMMGG